MPHTTRRIGVLFAASLASAFSQTVIAAEDFPSRPLRLVVTYPAGGPADTLARLLAPGLSSDLGRQVVIDNRGGAGGAIGVEAVVRAAPDGYTLLLGLDGPIAVNPSLYKKLSYNPLRDLAPVTQLTSSQLILLAHPSVSYRTIRDLVVAAKAQPGKITFASSGSGNASHLAGELLNSTTGIKLVHVPYKGAAPALTELIGGQVNLLFNNLLSGLPHVRSGKLVGIATTGAKRSPATADMPTMIESGLPGYEVSLWTGILVPAGTPRAIIARLHKAFSDTVQTAEVKGKLVPQGVEVVGSLPEAFGNHVKAEMEKWGKVVRESGARVD